MNYTKAEIIDSNAKLYTDIDSFIDDLLSARLHNDKDSEALAMSRAEGLLVATQQQLGCINDWLASKEKSKEIEERCDKYKFYSNPHLVAIESATTLNCLLGKK